MPHTNHAVSAEIILEQMLENPDGMETIRVAVEGLRESRWGDDLIDAIGQHGLFPASSWPMEQVAVFAMVHHLIYSGEVAQTLVGTSREPCADAEREANAATLSRLPHPFTAEVDMHQRTTGGDGIVRWGEPIWVETMTGLIARNADGSTAPYMLRFKIPPGRAVLEIGSTLPSRTWTHLAVDNGAVARWPYGYSCFRLMVNLGFMEMKDKMISEIMAMGRAGRRLVLVNPAQAELW